ncbi:MAG TPA: NAD(P)-dependent alcohol dehydrogenase, partial [Candidatus Limnocylindria bacterium]|nr:NAD(P)-dependent alcohol dehydrogenase [Candidatus Limnocylindria bacterium]
MKAIRQDRYGSPDLLQLAEVDKPELEDDRVLVRVRASSVNAGDWRQVRANPFLIRLIGGLRRPRSPLVGADVAGVVEAIGANVTDLQPGDEVMGIRSGAFAEYVCGANFVKKPANLSFEQAAAMPIAAITALQGLRDHGQVQPGHRVLINGAGGGVGTFAVQLAKHLGADVTAVTRSGNADLVKELGADRVIDYTREDFTRSGPYDLVVDVGGNRSIASMRRALAPDGRVVLIAAATGGLGVLGRIAAAAFRSRVLKQRVKFFVADVSKDDLRLLADLAEAGKIA